MAPNQLFSIVRPELAPRPQQFCTRIPCGVVSMNFELEIVHVEHPRTKIHSVWYSPAFEVPMSWNWSWSTVTFVPIIRKEQSYVASDVQGPKSL
jgi:hypothetical protein